MGQFKALFPGAGFVAEGPASTARRFGYPWTIVRATRRNVYLDALDAASAGQSILAFANFIQEEMAVDWSRDAAKRWIRGSAGSRW